ncbi:MAG: hypothetical protein WD557_01400 [Dehalococcoidia bacterium]
MKLARITTACLGASLLGAAVLLGWGWVSDEDPTPDDEECFVQGRETNWCIP